jgi:hypothetical protein
MSAITKKVVLLASALLFVVSAPAFAQRFGRGPVVVPRVHLYGPAFYDPWWWGPYYPYGEYPYRVDTTGDVRIEATPKQAAVYVDGYYAGVVDNFDGAFKHLHATPGGHAITLYLNGYRTVTEDVYVRPGATFKLTATMDRLPDGTQSAPPPKPAKQGGAAD